MRRPTTIYALIDPRDGQIRYIGKTVLSVEQRLRNHLGRWNLTPRRHSSCWLMGLVKAGLRPQTAILEVVQPGGDWQSAERKWIAHYRSLGARLTNLVDGGEGVAGYVFPKERREYLSVKFTGRKFDDEWRRKISEAKKGKPGKPQSAETIEKRAAARRATLAAKPPRTHCKNGHELTEINIYVSPKGDRTCRTCKRQQSLASLHRRKSPPITAEEHARRTREAMARPEVRERHRAAIAAREFSPEWRAQKREMMLRLREDPAFEAARRAGYLSPTPIE